MPDTRLYRLNQGFVPDPWLLLDEDGPLPAQGHVIVSLQRWREDGALLPASHTGVWIANDEDAEALPADILALPLIALQFPSFTDGRAFSQARLLRERRGYRGELRACGDVHSDQLLYMARCGFDAFSLDATVTAERIDAALGEFSFAYQPTTSGLRLQAAY